MRSSTLAALATAALVGSTLLFRIPSLQLDDRPASRIWDADVLSSVRSRWTNELGTLCLPKFAPDVCGAQVNTAIKTVTSPVRQEFEACVRNSWFRWRCTNAARQALQEVSVQSIMATVEKAITDRQAAAAVVAAQNNQAAQKARKGEADAERVMAAQIMGSDEGHSYLLRAYERRIAAAERECRGRTGMADLTEALIQSTRQFDPVGKACHAALRNKPFVIRPYGPPIMIGYPLPPFSQLWRPGKCADQGQQAWRCMQQAAEAIASRTAYWGELDHEINAALRSISDHQRQFVPPTAARPYRY